MKSLVVFLAILASVSLSFAECKEYKIVEHENSTEVVCADDNTNKAEGKAGQGVANSPRKGVADSPRKAKERCDLEYSSCTTSCSSGDRRCTSNCAMAKAQCDLTVLDMSPSAGEGQCKKRCDYEFSYCANGRSNIGDMNSLRRCAHDKAQCQMSCLNKAPF